MRPFERFIAIDWSGAKDCTRGGIEVAACSPGTEAPARIAPPGRHWTRENVLAFVLAQKDTRALIGFDFSFAPPCLDRGHYLPGLGARTAPEFWAFVDGEAPDDDLGAASLVEGPLRPHFYLGAACGDRKPFARLRRCEAEVARQGLGAPSPFFVCVGPAQVAKASLAGMRLLHRAREAGIAVWPFDPVPGDGPVLVEIYPRAFLRLAGGLSAKVRDAGALDAVLAALGAEPARQEGPLPDHLTDALVASAGLRRSADDPRCWHPQGLTPEAARTEGWIFAPARG